MIIAILALTYALASVIGVLAGRELIRGARVCCSGDCTAHDDDDEADDERAARESPAARYWAGLEGEDDLLGGDRT